MPQSEQIGELAKAIVLAQAELKPVKKECENPFFKSRYADLASVWEALKPFQAHGIAITQMPFDAGEGMIGITTQLSHTSGQWISGSLALPVSKHDAQGVGSAVTYARRYSLGCMTGVVTEEDDDGNQATQAKPAQRYSQNKQDAARKMAELRNEMSEQAPTAPKLTASNVCQQFALVESMPEWADVANAWQDEAECHTDDDRTKVKTAAEAAKKRIGGRK